MMFKSARWRSDKYRTKAVFKLQFHATQVTQLNAQALMISVVLGDGGKPRTILEKATVLDGNCRWENPVYETVKFAQDPKTRKINEIIYHFILSTGLGKGGLVGEASIDFSAFAEAIKTSTVSLPLKKSNSKAILHVSIQRLQENVDQREVEKIEDASIKTQDCILKDDESIQSDTIEDVPLSKATNNVELHGNRRGSSEYDITISSSGSISGFDTPRELGMRNNINHDPQFLSSMNNSSFTPKPTSTASTATYEEPSAGSDFGTSTDDCNNSQDTFPRENSQHGSDNEIERLKNELKALTRQVDVSDMELKALRKRIVKESKRGQDLSREVVTLKREKDALKLECEKLKAFEKQIDDATVKSRLEFESGDTWVLIEEIRQELNYEKALNSDLQLQLQKTQESNAELMLAVQVLEETFDAKKTDVPDPPKKSGSHGSAEELGVTISGRHSDEDDEQRELQQLVKAHRDNKETSFLEQKIMDLYREREVYKRDKDELEAQMEQLALDYELLKQENHDMSYKLEQRQLQDQLNMQYEFPSSFANINEHTKIECLESELDKQSKEFSQSLSTINKLETHIKSLEEELEKQEQVFEMDLETIIQAKVDQEQRAIRAEEALCMTRWKNANIAESLQEEFKSVSMQMAFTLDAHEKSATKALTEASELRLQNNELEELLKKAKEELQSVIENYEAKLCNLSNQVNLKSNQIEQMLEEIDDKSKQLEHQKKHEEEVSGAFSEVIRSLKAEIGKLTMERKCLHERARLIEKLEKKEDNITGMENKLKESNERAAVSDGTKTPLENDKSPLVSYSPAEVASLREKLMLLEGQIKLKEIALETSTNVFLEMEKNLHKKIDELESIVEELDVHSTSFCKYQLQKACKDSMDTSNDIISMPCVKSNGDCFSEKEPKTSIVDKDGNRDELIAEVASLRKRNESMQKELKEMQERYSEISLKFAEVEGARQQLVMTVRTLKNGKKC
ncbi:protein LURP-one-related 4-like [Hibiscus syriacus]|uniref:Protein LURP-one-related 4-like n=1 Tax=Hibiscus syriacus TaxID=106335 RepID=A0A6A2XQV9_HIBSY|nr:interaptin-like [Hibiscus syriacus]KAE8677988.1 protein LURP-one-related 4-like [Hibiscus syriacus]